MMTLIAGNNHAAYDSDTGILVRLLNGNQLSVTSSDPGRLPNLDDLLAAYAIFGLSPPGIPSASLSAGQVAEVQALIAGAVPSVVGSTATATGFTGFGATNTNVPCFGPVAVTGTAYTEYQSASRAANGSAIQVVTAGWAVVTAYLFGAASFNFCAVITKNTSGTFTGDPLDGPGSPSGHVYGDIARITTGGQTGGQAQIVTTGPHYFSVGDVIRIHSRPGKLDNAIQANYGYWQVVGLGV